MSLIYEIVGWKYRDKKIGVLIKGRKQKIFHCPPSIIMKINE